MQENILTKLKLKIIIPTILLSVIGGILLEKYLLNKFFNFEKNKDQIIIETNIKEGEVVEDQQEEKKLLRDTSESCSIYVDVSGALKEPGVYCLPVNSLIIDAVNKAGGFTNNIAYKYVSRKINLAQKVVNNQKIYFPFQEEMECKEISFLPAVEESKIAIENSGIISNNSESNNNQENNDTSQCININSATTAQLETLNGVGAATAQKIISGRPYQQIEDITNVQGIGTTLFNKIKDKICI